MGDAERTFGTSSSRSLSHQGAIRGQSRAITSAHLRHVVFEELIAVAAEGDRAHDVPLGGEQAEQAGRHVAGVTE